MKKVLIANPENEVVHLKDVYETTPIFAKYKGKLAGMIIYEKDLGWILRIGYDFGATGYHASRPDFRV